MRKLIGIAILALVLVLLVTVVPGCGKGEEKPVPGVTPTPGVTPAVTPTPTVKTLKIGFLNALSGPAAPYGTAHELGVKWAASDINAAGGLKVGRDIYMLKVVSCDDKWIASAAVECAQRLIYDEGCKFTIGGIGTVNATKGIFNDAKVINVGLGTTRPEATLPYHINGNTDTEMWAKTWAKQTYEAHPEVKTLAIISPNTPGSVEWLDAHEAKAVELGQTVVAKEVYTFGISDFYPLLTKIVAKKPDAISLDATPAGDQLLMTKQARELGFTGWIQHATPVSLALMKASMPVSFLYKIATNEEVFSDPVFTQSVRDLNDRWLKLYAKPGESMNTCVIHGYCHVNFLAKAIEQAGSIDVDQVLKVFDDPNFRFNRIYVEDAKIGGFETIGIRRQFPHFQAYSEIQDGQLKLIKAEVVELP